MNIDLTAKTAFLPGPGQTVAGTELAIHPGGKSANQAAAAALLGANVCLVGAVGDDSWGSFLLKEAAARGVDTSGVKTVAGCASGMALITVDEQAENTIVVLAGANARLRPVDLPTELLQTAEVVCLALEIPMETVVAAAAQAKRGGAMVMLNPSPWATLPAELLANTDVLVLNVHELAQATGLGFGPAAGPDQVASSVVSQVLGQLGVKAAVVTLGASGALVIRPGQEAVGIATHEVPVVDTTGCGDAFSGALAVGLAAGQSIEAAAQTAAAAGAYAAIGRGAQPSYPTLKQLDRFLAT